MATVAQIPTVISNYNVYRAGNRLIGVGKEMTLPDFEQMTATLSGAGIAGETDIPIEGHFPAMALEIPFNVLNNDAFSVLDLNGELLTIRSNIKEFDPGSNTVRDVPMKTVIGGIPKGFKPGKQTVGGTMDASASIELTYIKITINGQEKLEFDRFNYVYKINGVDRMANARKNI